MSLTDQRDTIVSLLVDIARDKPDLPLYTFLDSAKKKPAVLTSRALLCKAKKIAGMLQAQGICGEPVMVLSAYGPQAIELLFGVMLAGCSPVPATFHRRLGMANIGSIIASTGLRVVIGRKSTLEILRAGRIKSGPRFDASRYDLVYLVIDELQKANWRPMSIAVADVALIYPGLVCDEDSTPVPLSHADLLRNADNLIQTLSPDPDARDSLLTCMDLADGLTLVLHILMPIRARLPSIFFPLEHALRNAAPWIIAASRYGCTIISAPPAVLSLAAHNVAASSDAAVDLSKLRFVCIGGDYFAPGIVSCFIDRYGNNGMSVDKIFSCYGLSAAGAYLAGRPGFKTLVKDHVAYLALGEPDSQRMQEIDTGDRLLLKDNDVYCKGRLCHRFTVDGRDFQAEDIESVILQSFGVRGLSRCVALRIEDSKQTVLLVECAIKQLAENWQGAVPAMMDKVLADTGCRLDRVILLRPGSLPSAVSGIVLRQKCANALIDGSLMLRLLPVRGK